MTSQLTKVAKHTEVFGTLMVLAWTFMTFSQRNFPPTYCTMIIVYVNAIFLKDR